MANTIGDSQWEYLNLLNACIQIVATILLGVVVARMKVFDSQTFVPQAVKFVFRVCLPLKIMRAVGVVIDFYDPKFSWKYICAFLVLRAVALVLCVGWVLVTSIRGGQKHGVGQVAVYWLSLTWISTIILGVPISKAVFGSEALGQFYGIMAGISSFIFQLPLQLLFLECHVLEQDYLAEERRRSVHPVDPEAVLEDNQEENRRLDNGDDNDDDNNKADDGEFVTPQKEQDDLEMAPLFLWLKFARRGYIWRGIAIKILSNPVIWGIMVGFFLSLTKLGPTYLKPSSPDYVPGFGWFFTTCGWMGDMVSPVSLFTMGVWMQNQGKELFQISWYTAVLNMVSKLVLVPIVMIGLAKGMNLSNEAGRAAVMIAALPISMASFSLAGHYKIGVALLSSNVALGTILMLPTILVWNLVMDEIGLFPIDPA